MDNLQLSLISKNKKIKKYKFLIFIIIIFILFFISFMPVKVIGHSMENTIKEGDIYIVNKLEYLFKNPEYKDIVLIKSYKNNEQYYIIKRVIGVPGDIIVIEDNKVYVNDELLIEEYIKDDINLTKKRIEIKLEDEIFVMGDNRAQSRDSRSKMVGAINVDRVVGKALLKYTSKN